MLLFLQGPGKKAQFSISCIAFWVLGIIVGIGYACPNA
jgi:hypothetical protein